MRLPVVLVAVALAALCATPIVAQEGVRRDRPSRPKAAPVLTKPPELIEAAHPEYPAAGAGLDADVKVRLHVGADGSVGEVEVPDPVGHGFDEAAAAAARSYRFQPAEFDGKPGPIVIETTIHFRHALPESQPASSTAETQPAESAPSTQPLGNAVLEGSVKERGTRRALAGIAVALREVDQGPPLRSAPRSAEPSGSPDREVETDARGRFRIEGLPAGKYQLVVLGSGFDRAAETVSLAEAETRAVVVYLRPAGGNPYETVVEGQREKLEVTRRTMTRRELTTVPGTFGDPLRVLQSLPGLARAPFDTGILLIRGSNPNDSGVFVDGHSIPLLYHFLGGPSILNPEFLESIDLYPGGFPARFGRFHGGVIDVTTRATATDGVHGSAKVDLLDSGGYVRAPLSDHIAIAVAGRRSYIDALLPLVLPTPSPGDTLVVAPVYWDYQARLDIDLPARQHLSFLVLGSDDSLHVLQTSAENARTLALDSHIGFHRVRALYSTPLTGDLTLTLSPDFGLDDLHIVAGAQTSTVLHNTVSGLRERVVGKLAEGLRLDAGLDIDSRVTSYDLKVPNNQDIRTPIALTDIPPELISRSVDLYGLGAYAELAWDLGPIRVIPALRGDAYFLNGKPRFSVDPRFVIRGQVAAPTALKAYVGLFHEPPAPELLDNTFGNPDLDLERALHLGVGIEQKLTSNLELDAELYAIERDGLPSFTTDVVMRPDGTLRRVNVDNAGHGRTLGLELYLKHKVTERLYGWLSYTLSRTVLQARPDQLEAPAPFDQTHNIVAVASVRLGKGWETGARFQLSTGRPQTPVIGATFNSDTDRYVPLQGDLRSDRRATFSQLDLRLEKTWLFDTWSIGLFLDVMNVFNTENAEATQYDYRFRATAPVRGVPILPDIGMKGQW
jgi:TonB family protein